MAPFQPSRWSRIRAPEARRFALRAWFGAPLVRASLALAGLQATLRWIEAVPVTRRARDRVGVAEGERLIHGVFRHHFVGGECLPRSVLQYLLHRRDGLPVRFIVGVRRDDRQPTLAPRGGLAAHAWVEDGHEAGASSAFTPIFVAEAT
jgi:Transglutaminase-like superfamily